MSRVLLVSFAGYPYSPSSLLPDNGLACLAGCLMEAGHEVRILDYGTVGVLERLFPKSLGEQARPLAEKLFVEGRGLSLVEKARFLRLGMKLERHQAKQIEAIAGEAAREAERYEADVVGLKLWNGDGFTGSVRIAEAIRERLAHVRIVGGGPQVDYFRGHILDYTDVFDALVHGEGERVFPALVEAMGEGKDWRNLPGVIRREGTRIHSNPAEALPDLNGQPLPVYDPEIYPALRGNEKIKIGVVDESRGCPNRCAFCIHPIKSGGHWCLKSPERVVAEMRRLGEQMGTRYFVYSGSNTSARVAVGIAEAIVAEGLDVRYGCFGHVRGIARADFDLLRRSGCEAIFYGLESGSQRILREAFNKPLDLGLTERVIRDTMAAGIYAITSVIFPAPFEDAASRAETLDFLRKVRPDSVPVTIPGMIPGTPWERDPERYGFEKARRRDIWRYAMTYKIKLLFPPALWKPLPYRLNGKSSRRLFKECTAFVKELERDGFVTHVPHELVLMAHALGERDDVKGFRDRNRAWFFSGAADEIAAMTASLNRSVRPRAKSARDVRAPAFAGLGTGPTTGGAGPL